MANLPQNCNLSDFESWALIAKPQPCSFYNPFTPEWSRDIDVNLFSLNERRKKINTVETGAAHEHQGLSSLIIYDTVRIKDKGLKEQHFLLWERFQTEK